MFASRRTPGPKHRSQVGNAMKKLLIPLLLAVTTVFGADAANDLLLTHRNSGNTGNIQRNVTATANGVLLFDGSLLPVSSLTLSGLTAVSATTFTGALTGNATTATTLANTR